MHSARIYVRVFTKQDGARLPPLRALTPFRQIVRAHTPASLDNGDDTVPGNDRRYVTTYVLRERRKRVDALKENKGSGRRR